MPKQGSTTEGGQFILVSASRCETNTNITNRKNTMKNPHLPSVVMILAASVWLASQALTASEKHAAPNNPFANTTLSYISHTADNNIYFGNETKGQCQYYSHSFRTQESSQGTMSYSIKQLDHSKWEIVTTDDADPRSNRTFVFWITAMDLNAPDGQIVIKAEGNAYHDGNPLWPSGKRCMTLTFRRGNHLQQIF
jgi:hypothetical protein